VFAAPNGESGDEHVEGALEDFDATLTGRAFRHSMPDLTTRGRTSTAPIGCRMSTGSGIGKELRVSVLGTARTAVGLPPGMTSPGGATRPVAVRSSAWVLRPGHFINEFREFAGITPASTRSNHWDPRSPDAAISIQAWPSAKIQPSASGTSHSGSGRSANGRLARAAGNTRRRK